ncbi:hypothetical protein HYU17_04760 [Candidatus Woesearchaeota archaeon]|nr:hypothetical protein [Candidatus Woesearchaeota archaeon]
MPDTYKPILETLDKMVRNAGLELSLDFSCTDLSEVLLQDTNNKGRIEAAVIQYLVSGPGGELAIIRRVELPNDGELKRKLENAPKASIYAGDIAMHYAPAEQLRISFWQVTGSSIGMEIAPDGSITTDSPELLTAPNGGMSYRAAFRVLLGLVKRIPAEAN